LFVTFLVLAVLRIHKNDPDGHARYMAGTVLFALEPAQERVFVFYVPGVSGFASALYFALNTMEIRLAVLLLFEWRRHKVRLPFALALGFFVATYLLDAGCELCSICKFCEVVRADLRGPSQQVEPWCEGSSSRDAHRFDFDHDNGRGQG
jgi:hypothetical protein